MNDSKTIDKPNRINEETSKTKESGKKGKWKGNRCRHISIHLYFINGNQLELCSTNSTKRNEIIIYVIADHFIEHTKSMRRVSYSTTIMYIFIHSLLWRCVVSWKL